MTKVAVERYFAGHFNLELKDNAFERIEVSVFSPKKSMYLGHLGEFQPGEIRWSIRKEYPERKLAGRMQLKFSDGFLKMLHDCRQFGSFKVKFYLDGVMAAEGVIPSYSFTQTSELPDISRPAGEISFIELKPPESADSGTVAGGATDTGGPSAGTHADSLSAEALSKAFSSAMNRSGRFGNCDHSSDQAGEPERNSAAGNAGTGANRADDGGSLKPEPASISADGDTSSESETSSAYSQRDNYASGGSSRSARFSSDPRLDSRPFDKNWDAPGVFRPAVYMLLAAVLIVFCLFWILK